VGYAAIAAPVFCIGVKGASVLGTRSNHSRIVRQLADAVGKALIEKAAGIEKNQFRRLCFWGDNC
jgi:hypothetical protein